MAYRLVIHVNEDSRERLNAAINMAYNLLDLVGEGGAEVAFVFNWRGPAALMRGSVDGYTRERVNELLNMNVRLYVCSISMRSLGLRAEDLIDGVEVVDSGVKKIVELQSQGYAYVKA